MDVVGIREPVLRELIQASAEMSARVVGWDCAFRIIIRVASGEKTLVTSRGSIRLFASLDTAAGFLGDLGMLNFDVDVSHYKAGRLRGPRPDRAEAQRRTRTKMYQQPLGLEI
jgi:hypothetical protein